MSRPRILVLAGVNGAGKSSVAGQILADENIVWFNPDRLSRVFVERAGMDREAADAATWEYGRRRLETAIAEGLNHAFETTLGGSSITRLLVTASKTHDVIVLYFGLASVEQHIARVEARVRHGGHSIPEERIRARWDASREHLIELLPHLAALQLFDNSVDVEPGEDIPAPMLLMEMRCGKVLRPKLDDAAALAAIPHWAKPIVAAALRLDAPR